MNSFSLQKNNLFFMPVDIKVQYYKENIYRFHTGLTVDLFLL